MSNEGFPLPEKVVPVDTGRQSPTNLTRQLKKLQLRDMKLRMVKLDNDHWLQRRGKKQYVGFSPQDKWEAKQFFAALDTDNCGAISLDELYQPLLASGIIDSKAQIQHIFPKSPFGAVLEFNEFLGLLETGRNEISPVGRLVKEYIFRQPEKQLLPYQVLISTSRRKLMLQAYRGDTQSSKDKGLKVLKAFSSELKTERRQSKAKSELLAAKKKGEAFRSLTFRQKESKSRFPSIREPMRARSQVFWRGSG